MSWRPYYYICKLKCLSSFIWSVEVTKTTIDEIADLIKYTAKNRQALPWSWSHGNARSQNVAGIIVPETWYKTYKMCVANTQ